MSPAAAAGGRGGPGASQAQPCPAGSRDGRRAGTSADLCSSPRRARGGLSRASVAKVGHVSPPCLPRFSSGPGVSSCRGLLSWRRDPCPPLPDLGQTGRAEGRGPAQRPVLAALTRPHPAGLRGSVARLSGWNGGPAGSLLESWAALGSQEGPGCGGHAGQLPAQRAPAPRSPTDGGTALLARPVIDGLVIREPGDHGESWTCALSSEGPGSHSHRRDLAPQAPPRPASSSLPPPPPRLRGGQPRAQMSGRVCRNRVSAPSPLLRVPGPSSRPSSRFQLVAAGGLGPAGASSAGRWAVPTSRGRAGGGGGAAQQGRGVGERRAVLTLACPPTLVRPSVPAPAPAVVRGPVQGRASSLRRGRLGVSAWR